MARLKVEPTTLTANSNNAISLGNLNLGIGVGGGISSGIHHQQLQNHPGGTMVAATPTGSTGQLSGGLQGTQILGSIDCYEDVFKEITKKLYGDESGGIAIADVLDSAGVSGNQQLVYDAGDLFSQGTTGGLGSTGGGGLAIVAGPGTNGIPTGTILVQRRLQDDKGRIWTIEGLPNSGEQIAFATLANPAGGAIQTMTQAQQQQQLLQTAGLQQTQFVVQQQSQQQQQQQQQLQVQQIPLGGVEERWFESDENLTWTQSKIARYNPTQKVFRCVDCDFVGFLSRVAEHWLGNHADLRVFQCPRCPYTSAWARCVRMHLTRQHGETLTDNSLWKENPVLEEVTKFLNTLKTKVEQKNEPANPNGEKRYICPYCTYQTDRRDLYNRHENIHRDEKPFQCYVCDKQFNRADHVKKHFIRIHREHPYDINKIRKVPAKGHNVQFLNGSKLASKQRQPQQLQQQGQNRQQQIQIQLPQTQQQLVQQQDQGQYNQLSMKQGLLDGLSLGTGSSTNTIAVQIQQGTGQAVAVQQIPHLAYFNPPLATGQNGPLQGIQGVGGTKKQGKGKGQKKKRSSEKMYTCSYCPWQGVDNWCLKRHLNTHIKPFLCALCDYKAARSERLATHVLKVHNKRVCHKCSFLADDTESLSQHIQDSHQNPLVKTGFNCNLCQEYFELRADLEAHAILEHQKVIVQCDLCDFRTTDELSMEAHLRDKHNLTPGMGAVAAAAAAAAAAAVGQPLNAQYLQNQQSQVQISEQMDTSSDQGLSQVIASTQQQLSGLSSTESPEMEYSTSTPDLQISKVIGNATATGSVEAEPAEPETLCEKCGIDFVDEESRKLHEKRHELVNPEEDDAVKGAKGLGTKRLTRNYICSTCSYTCATKKMMMQHQRSHTGFELVCKAENCMFSTPFENTLKEHIQNDHGSEEHVRCPHCGLRMPSNSAFTSHWRLHHRTVCSLCVNIYRIRYDVKENDVHDVVCKIQNPPPTQVSNNPVPPPAPVKSGSLGFSNDLLPPSSGDALLAGLGGMGMPEELPQPQPPPKKSKMDQPENSSTAILYKRESIKFLPRLVEVIVAPMPPKTKRKFSSRRRRGRSRKWMDQRKPTGNIEGATPNFTPPSSSDMFSLEGARKGSPFDASTDKRIDMMLNAIQQRESKRRNGFVKVSLHRRYCQKGTFPWLYRNPREGFKCLSSLCENRRSWRYTRRIGLILHQRWFHRIPRFKCDICGLPFPHMYKAVLHKSIEHADFPQQPTKHQSHQSLGQVQLTQFQQQIDNLNLNAKTHGLGGTVPAPGIGNSGQSMMLS